MKKVISAQCSVLSGRWDSRSILYLLFAIFSATAAAQESKTNAPAVLPTVVVTATRTEEPVDKTAASVSVITRTAIDEQKFSTLAEALASVPGLVVARNGTPGQATAVFLRGTESNHTLLTVDGRRAPAMLAGGYDWGNLSLDNVERIEVVRSASSALYGGDAIGGVVNIITRTGRGLKQPEYEASFEGGSFNSFRETLATRGAVGAFDYAVSASQFNAAYPRDNNDYRNSSVRGSFGYEVSDKLYLDLKLAYSQSDGGSPGNVAFGPDLTSHFEREIAHFSPGISWQVSDKLETKLTYTFENQFQPTLDFGDINRLNVGTHLVELQNNLTLRDNWKATFGAFFQEQAVDRTTASFGVSGINANASTHAGYAQSQLSLFDHLTLINAFRFDAYSDYQSAFTWRQGAAYNLADTATTLFANVSRSVAPPTAQDLYFETDFPPFGLSPGFKSAGNPNLRPEVALAFEAGVRQKLAEERVEVTATYFRTELEDAITFVNRAYPTASTAENISQAIIEGFEGTASYRPATALSLAGSYTYLTTRDETTGLRLLRRPRHQLGLEATVKPAEKLSISVGGSWLVERQDAGPQQSIGDILLLRANVACQVSKNTQLWVRGENLLDKKYEELRGFPALRLGVYGGVKWSF